LKKEERKEEKRKNVFSFIFPTPATQESCLFENGLFSFFFFFFFFLLLSLFIFFLFFSVEVR